MTRMITGFCLLIAALTVMTLPAHAMPRDVASLRALVAEKYGGDATLYVNTKHKHFRKMGCEGRVDLLQALLDDGLNLYELTRWPRTSFLSCAYQKAQMSALKLIATPDVITAYEQDVADDKYSATLFDIAITRDRYDRARFFLERGVHVYQNRYNKAPLTREENLLLAADSIVKKRRTEAIRAFQDAGFGHIIDAARNPANVTYVLERAGRKGAGGGGFLRGVAGMAAGVALGGAEGAVIGAMSAKNALDGDEADQGVSVPRSGPLPLDTKRADLDAVLIPTTVPQRGLKVDEVTPGGASDRAGLAAGDVILAIAGTPVASRGSFYVATHNAAKTAAFAVRYLRDGAPFTATFQPQAQEGESETKTAPSAASDMASKLDALDRLGTLRDRGVLSPGEFETMKATILEGM
jgi:hypothetical protein